MGDFSAEGEGIRPAITKGESRIFINATTSFDGAEAAVKPQKVAINLLSVADEFQFVDLREGLELILLIDGKRVPSDMFEKSSNAPVSFTILLDASGSMALAGKMDAARAAIGALIAHRRPGDDFSLFVFAESEARELVPFTEDAGAITRALATVTPYGKTAFFDALSTMPERSRLGKNPSRAIVLLSDGIDNASTLTRADLTDARNPVANRTFCPEMAG